MGSRTHMSAVNPVGLDGVSLARALRHLHFIITTKIGVRRVFTSAVFLTKRTNKLL